AAVGRVEGQPADVGQAVARLGRAPDVHVVGLAVAEDVTDLFAVHEGGRGSSNVAGLQPVVLGRVEIHPNIDLGHVFLEADVLLGDAGDRREQVFDVLRLG